MNFRNALVLLVAALPASGFKNLLLRRLGWTIGPGVRIGPCLVLNVDRVEIGVESTLGAFNVLRDLKLLRLGDYSDIGHWNWVSCARLQEGFGAPCELYVGDHTAIISRHLLDCTGGVRIGNYTSIGGSRSTFLSHALAYQDSKQTSESITIGDYCLLGSNVQVLAGTTVGDKIVIGMGSTIGGRLLEPGIYASERAKLVKSNVDGEYFERKQGRVWAIRAHGEELHSS